MKRILVTGAAGRVGSHLVKRVRAQNVALRRMLERPGPQDEAAQDSIVGDHNDPACMARAFASVDAAFMYAPATDASTAVFQAARAAGVRKVVLLSSVSVSKAPPGTNPIAERHRAAEEAVKAAGLAWVFLRPDTMASNALQWATSIRAEARVDAPYPQSLRNPVHEDDIAMLAAQALLSDALDGQAIEFTGPEVISIAEQVRCIGTLLGRDVRCVEISPQEALARMTQGPAAMPRLAAERLLEYQKRSVDVAPRLNHDFLAITGHMPRTFSQWARDNLAAFQPEGEAPMQP